MIRAALEVLPESNQWCVEFGAWDGRFCSNTHRLMDEEGWSGVFIEADPGRFRDLERTYAANPGAVCVNALVSFDGPSSLADILGRTPVPRDFDLLSIDTDGTDYHLWRSLTGYRPKLVVIEFNPTIPPDVDFVQPADPAIHQGTSLAALARLGKEKGYELVAVADGGNAFFVTSETFPLFEIEDNSPSAVHSDRSLQTRVWQLYDGTLCWEGCTKLIWHDVGLGRPQVLPRRLRHFPGTEPTLRARLAEALRSLPEGHGRALNPS